MRREVSDLTVPIIYCLICDSGKVAMEVPDEVCGHGYEQRATFMMPVQPIDSEIRIPSFWLSDDEQKIR